RSWRAVPIRQREGTEVPDARPRARLPDEAVYSRGRAPFIGGRRGPVTGPRDSPAQDARESDALRREGRTCRRRARIHPVETLIQDPARALDLRAAPLKLHHSAARPFAGPVAGLGQSRAGVDQRLPPSLDARVALY